jgi:pyruvate/2-oxoglutarate dehydrogenase complex dihydrolipoamide acyltransferase (E2) component
MDITVADLAWQGVDAGTQALVDKWLVQEGDTVRRGQPLANVVLVKTNLEIVAPADGRVEKILVPPGNTFSRGAAIARMKEAT